MFLTKQAVKQIFFVTINSANANSSVLFRVNITILLKLDFSLSQINQAYEW